VASRSRPDVALVDVRMPGGGGPQATRDILRTSPSTKVVALSAHEEEEAVGEMLAAGALAYLLKGVTAEVIVEAIHRAAARPLLDLAGGPPTLELPA
jgi:DNA-binding NarL/FixJ family response regulator